MPPVEIRWGKDTQRVEANNSANFHFEVRGVKDTKVSIHVESKKNGGEVTIQDGDRIDHLTLKPGEINKDHSYYKNPILLFGV